MHCVYDDFDTLYYFTFYVQITKTLSSLRYKSWKIHNIKKKHWTRRVNYFKLHNFYHLLVEVLSINFFFLLNVQLILNKDATQYKVYTNALLFLCFAGKLVCN